MTERKAFTVEYGSGVAEAERGMDRFERKDITPWRAGRSFEDRDNFVTNRVTVAEYNDAGRESGIGISATYACVKLLAGTIASLPVMVYRTNAQGVRQVDKAHPLYNVLHSSPNFDQTAVDFWEFVSAGVELRGNSYAFINKRANGDVYDLRPIYSKVDVRRRANGTLVYSGTEDGAAFEREATDILHIRGFGGNALGAPSTLAVCSRTFTAAANAENAASNMFQRGAMPSGILSTDKTMTPEQRKLAEELLQQKFVGSHNAGRPMLLDNGVKWEQLTITPEDAQMLETRRFGIEEVCRIFGVPPSMVGMTDGSSMWGTGIEQQVLGFQKFALRPRLKRIEQALEKQLLTPSDKAAGVTIEFNLEGLLRGDTETRFNSYQTGLMSGIYTVNEVRALENLPPVPGGDEARVQMQNVPLTDAGGDGNAA